MKGKQGLYFLAQGACEGRSGCQNAATRDLKEITEGKGDEIQF